VLRLPRLPAFTTYYLVEYPTHDRAHPPTIASSLPPVTAVVLAAVLAGFVLVVRLSQAGMTFDAGVISYLLYGPVMVVLTGSAAAAALGRSFRAGLSACAWAAALATPLIIAAWLAEGAALVSAGSRHAP
jgi:hypothetical protein